MLQCCVSEDRPNAFYNEFLRGELHEHRRVFEALGAQMRVEENDNQLSGIGFPMGRRNDVVIKVKTPTERLLRVGI